MESPAVVAIYESRFWRRNPLFARLTGISFDDEIRLVGDALGLAPGSRVLDLACGSGITARPLARRVPEGGVVGLDLSWPMLRQARQRAAREGCRNLALVRGSALALPFAAGRFDAASCCGALHLFPDVPLALSEIHRVLAPGGRFAAAVFREGASPRERRAAARRRRLLDVDAFTREGLSRDLATAGFSDFRALHEHGPWMLVAATARRPAGAK